MIDEKNFFDQPVKIISNTVTYENIRKIATGQGDDYTAGCLLDHKIIVVDVSKQIALDTDHKAIHQINFTANLDRAGDTK